MKFFWKSSNECQFSPDILALKNVFFVCVYWALLEGSWGDQKAQCPLDTTPQEPGFPSDSPWDGLDHASWSTDKSRALTSGLRNNTPLVVRMVSVLVFCLFQILY